MSSSDSQTRSNPNEFQRVRQRWAIVEDGALAKELQNDEAQFHFAANRAERRTVRGDIQVARREQGREQLREQAERLRRAQDRRREEEGDAELALRVQDAARPPREVVVRAELHPGPSAAATEEEERLAQLELERRDELMARGLQEREERRYERWKSRQREKELRRERRRLERAIAADVGQGGAPTERAARGEDEGDFSDFYQVPADASDTMRARVQAEQDEELARLLQEQESKRRGGDRHRLEEQDHRLAEIIQQQEELRASRRRRQRRLREQRVNDAGTQTAAAAAAAVTAAQEVPPGRDRSESPVYDQLASSWTSPRQQLSVAIPGRQEEEEEAVPLYFDNGSPLVDNSYVGSPVTRLDEKIRAGNRLVTRRPGTRESLIEAVTGSAELGAQLASRAGGHGAGVRTNPGPVDSPSTSTPTPPDTQRSNRPVPRPQEEPGAEYAVSQIPRVIAVNPPPSHRAHVRQPGPFAFENSTLFRPAVPFSNPEAATTPLGPTFNIAAAIDPTYRGERAKAARPVRPKSMYELTAAGTKKEREEIWEEGVPIPIHGERRQSSDPRIGASADKKGGNCKVQ